MQELIPSRGFQSSMSYEINIGLGNYERIDSLHVTWPNNKKTILKNVDVNQKLTLNIEEANATAKPGI